MSNSEVRMVQGSREYLYADLQTDRVLGEQAIALSISSTRIPEAWLTAEWVGVPARARSARVLLDGTLLPGVYNVFARITDAPEAPIIPVGKLRIS
jgi:hypothetical protein